MTETGCFRWSSTYFDKRDELCFSSSLDFAALSDQPPLTLNICNFCLSCYQTDFSLELFRCTTRCDLGRFISRYHALHLCCRSDKILRQSSTGKLSFIWRKQSLQSSLWLILYCTNWLIGCYQLTHQLSHLLTHLLVRYYSSKLIARMILSETNASW